MKKLFLIVIGLVLMAGTIFSHQKARSFTPDNEGCFLSEHVPLGDLCILNNKITQATNQNLSALQPYKISNFSCNDCTNAALTHNPELEISCINHTCLDCSVDNYENDITSNGIAQKRVDILIC